MDNRKDKTIDHDIIIPCMIKFKFKTESDFKNYVFENVLKDKTFSGILETMENTYREAIKQLPDAYEAVIHDFLPDLTSASCIWTKRLYLPPIDPDFTEEIIDRYIPFVPGFTLPSNSTEIVFHALMAPNGYDRLGSETEGWGISFKTNTCPKDARKSERRLYNLIEIATTLNIEIKKYKTITCPESSPSWQQSRPHDDEGLFTFLIPVPIMLPDEYGLYSTKSKVMDDDDQVDLKLKWTELCEEFSSRAKQEFVDWVRTVIDQFDQPYPEEDRELAEYGDYNI